MNRIIFTLALLILVTPLALSAEECKSEMDAYGKTQTITANLLNYLSDPGKMREVTDYYGEQNKIAEAYIKEGKYQEACDVYQGVIDKYEMKPIEEQYYEKHPEKRPENQKSVEKGPEPASAVSSGEAASVSGDAAGAASAE